MKGAVLKAVTALRRGKVKLKKMAHSRIIEIAASGGSNPWWEISNFNELLFGPRLSLMQGGILSGLKKAMCIKHGGGGGKALRI